MTAFISHSFSNKAEFRNVADFLTQVNSRTGNPPVFAPARACAINSEAPFANARCVSSSRLMTR